MTCRDSRSGRGDRRARAARATHPRPGVEPGDLERLNSLLNADLRFEMDFREPHGGGTTSGILVCEPPHGLRRTATCPVVFSRRRRKFLHSLSGSLAECAMALGLGAGVYCEHALSDGIGRYARSGGARPVSARARHVSHREWP